MISQKRIAILQSNYIPWKGYFDLIAYVDEFIIYDDMQYTRRDWRNRNRIKTADGLQWLSVPVKVKGKFWQKIRETEIAGKAWQKKHWRTLAFHYAKAPFFREISEWIAPLYLEKTYSLISELNRLFIEHICSYLQITTKIKNSWDYSLSAGKSERLADLCVQAGGSEYVSGPSAKNYINKNVFADRKLKLTWFDYSGYPLYPQLYGDFVHEVSILDLLFHCGPTSGRYMKFV